MTGFPLAGFANSPSRPCCEAKKRDRTRCGRLVFAIVGRERNQQQPAGEALGMRVAWSKSRPHSPIPSVIFWQKNGCRRAVRFCDDVKLYAASAAVNGNSRPPSCRHRWFSAKS